VTSSLPALFLPHGAPDLALSGHSAARFLQGLGQRFARPKGIVIISAHWETDGLALTTAGTLPTIHDFAGFAPALYELSYPAATSPDLIAAVSDRLCAAGRPVLEDPARGLDHGAWVPLMLAYPEADIPVVQLSLDRQLDPAGHLAVGRALAGLREEGILVVGSGATVHNLRLISPEGSPPARFATAFDGWIEAVLQVGDFEKLAEFGSAPQARMAHPTPEHLLPLLVAAGAGGAQGRATRLHAGYSYGSIGMSAFAFS